MSSLILDKIIQLDDVYLAQMEATLWLGPLSGDGKEGETLEDTEANRIPKLDLSKILRFTGLDEVDKEGTIQGFSKLRILQRRQDLIVLNGADFIAVRENFLAHGMDSAIEKLRRDSGVNYLDFYGNIVRSKLGHPCVLFIRRGRARWHTGLARLSENFTKMHTTATYPRE